MATYTTLAEAKAHLRIDFTDDDGYIAALQNLVEELVLTEIYGTEIGIGTVTTNGTTALTGLTSNFLDFVAGNTITVYGESIRTIATITDDTNLTVTAAFTTSTSGLAYAIGKGLPSPLPLGLKQAMLLLIGHYYLLREPVNVGSTITEIPMTYKYLIQPYKNYTIQ